MVRGLCASWKQCIYLDFDQEVSKDILLMLIKKLESIGIQIVGMVNDMGTQNMRLWKNLNISVDQTSFENPHDANQAGACLC